MDYIGSKKKMKFTSNRTIKRTTSSWIDNVKVDTTLWQKDLQREEAGIAYLMWYYSFTLDYLNDDKSYWESFILANSLQK